MDLRNLKNEIINENGVCTIKTETTFSDCVVGDGIILAISKERKQLIKYTSDLDIISVEPIEYVSMQEYRFKKLIFLVFETNTWATKKVMMMSKGNAEWIELWMSKPATSCDTIDKIKGIYQLHPKKYIIITTELDSYDRRCLMYKDVVAEIDLDTNQTKKMFIFSGKARLQYNYNHESSPRFIFFHDYHSSYVREVFDLYTGFSYSIPDSSVENKEDIIQCYSSKETMVLEINQEFYLYINGYLVYQYTSEEYESVLCNLRNNIRKHSHGVKNSKTDYFFTVRIGESLCIWKKNEKPEMITL